MTLTAAMASELAARAEAARAHAHAPYSRFRVGAAVLSDDGSIHGGCNVENASFGLTICAERVAAFQAVCAGVERIDAVAVSAEPAVWPCGACRQVLAEFAGPECEVVVAHKGVVVASARLTDLLPYAFIGDTLPTVPGELTRGD